MCFELGKIFPRLQRDGGRVNLKVFTKKIAVNADAHSLAPAQVMVSQHLLIMDLAGTPLLMGKCFIYL